MTFTSSRTNHIYEMTRLRAKFFPLAALALAAAAMAYQSLHAVISRNFNDELYSHIPLIPIIGSYLLYRQRLVLLQALDSWHLPGIWIMSLGAGMFIFCQFAGLPLLDFATASTLSTVVFLLGAFLFVFGVDAFRKAGFAMAMFSFIIPPPNLLMNRAVTVLVKSSAFVTHWLFHLLNVPFVQEGSVFFLPGLNIEITRACSGMRSTIALLVTSLLAGHLFLDKLWKRVLLVALVFPIAVLRNGVRITALYLLAYFVDEDAIMGGFLHNSGGFIFFFLGLVILGLVLWFLRNSDKQSPHGA